MHKPPYSQIQTCRDDVPWFALGSVRQQVYAVTALV